MSIETYLRFALALGLVIAIIVALAWMARRYGFGGIAVKPAGKRRRLGVVEVLTLDPRRRLVIVRRDNVEHLLLLGGTQETVVETGIPSSEAFSLSPKEPA